MTRGGEETNFERQVTQLPLLVTNLLAGPFYPRFTGCLAACFMWRGLSVMRLEGVHGANWVDCLGLYMCCTERSVSIEPT